MSEETQGAPQPRRVDDHAGASANPEQHLKDAHNLSIQVQGREGPWGRAKWALVREEKDKVKTLTVFEGTRLEASHHFYKFMHSVNPAAVAAAQPGRSGGYRQGPRTGGYQGGGRPQGRPTTGGRPGGSPAGRPTGRP